MARRKNSKRQLKGFIEAMGFDYSNYPLTSKVKVPFIDGNRNKYTSRFRPNSIRLTPKDTETFKKFLQESEEMLSTGQDPIERILIAHYIISINPFTEKLRLFMRDV